MKKREPSLRFYTALLHLYPTSFRKKYEEQLLLTAADILMNKQSTAAVVLANIRLCFDTLVSALEAQYGAHRPTLQPQLHGTTPRSAFRSLLFALETTAILVLTFVWALQAKAGVDNAVYYFGHSGYTLVQQVSQTLAMFVLLAYLPLAIILVARHARLPLRATLRWSYLFTLGGTISFVLFAMTVYRLVPLSVAASDGSDLLVISLYTVLYYATIKRLAKKLARKQLAPTS